MFNRIIKKEFSKVFEISSFDTGNFLRKIPQNYRKNSEIFLLFSKTKKTIILNLD